MNHSLIGRGPLSRRGLLAGAGALALAGVSACDSNRPAPDSSDEPADPNAPSQGSLEWAVAGDWRAADRARDVYRHPIETLNFFGLAPRMTVIEFWPGAGWWTEILAPYLAANGGTLYAATFQNTPESDQSLNQIVARFENRFASNRRLYGDVRISEFGPTSGPVAPEASADLVMFMRNLHNWMAAGIAEKAFADAYAALKPGGVLGIEQHRADAGAVQDPVAANGYVQEAFVKQLAAEAGFAFVAASEANANPADTKDHPFGVWTLPPQSLTAPRGDPPDPEFDRSAYDAIGESDRMTLKFRKPE
ncbi:MAG: class I SAM-dependent methyltransferase [Brevundimonas sp.]|uniref:class I SAM-dependent methyltransferase n=1 Tax=Brevundimonas sp. TaxID=1871086 RepID=UPI00391D1A57